VTQEEFVVEMARRLDAAGIAFMIVGSVGATHYGKARSTYDVDIVIDPTPEPFERFIAAFGDDYYVSAAAAKQALRQRSMFNVIHTAGGWKADLIVRGDRPFSLEQFRRRRAVQMYGRSLPVASAEDLVLAKLEWNKITPSDRQLEDAFNVIAVQGAKLNRDYLQKWAPQLGVAEKLTELLGQADEMRSPPVDDEPDDEVLEEP
jgi:hypothetical protein